MDWRGWCQALFSTDGYYPTAEVITQFLPLDGGELGGGVDQGFPPPPAPFTKGGELNGTGYELFPCCTTVL